MHHCEAMPCTHPTSSACCLPVSASACSCLTPFSYKGSATLAQHKPGHMIAHNDLPLLLLYGWLLHAALHVEVLAALHHPCGLPCAPYIIELTMSCAQLALLLPCLTSMSGRCSLWAGCECFPLLLLFFTRTDASGHTWCKAAASLDSWENTAVDLSF